MRELALLLLLLSLDARLLERTDGLAVVLRRCRLCHRRPPYHEYYTIEEKSFLKAVASNAVKAAFEGPA